MTDTLFYSVDDPELYNLLEQELPGAFPDLRIAFCGHTFGDFPNWMEGRKHELLPSSRLMWSWVFMNEHTSRVVVPAFKDNDVVIVRGLGRDAYHFAVRYAPCAQTLHIHEELVHARIVTQGLKPPLYMVKKPTDLRLLEADADYCASGVQRIRYFNGPSTEAMAVEFIRQLETDTSDLTIGIPA